MMHTTVRIRKCGPIVSSVTSSVGRCGCARSRHAHIGHSARHWSTRSTAHGLAASLGGADL
eukprot:4571026-Prymnesium_polylepis.1